MKKQERVVGWLTQQAPVCMCKGTEKLNFDRNLDA